MTIVSRYAGEWWQENGTDLGDGHWIQLLEDGVTGYFAHRNPDGSICWGRIPLSGLGESWKIVSREPLTIEPSILCETHGVHGFIRDGKWVPA